MHICRQGGTKIVMESNNGKKDISDRLMAVLFILLFMGSVFIVSGRDYDLFDTYRKYWTITLGLFFIIYVSVCLLIKKGKIQMPIDTILKSIFATGVLECIYALAQFFKILPTYNRYYAYTGSFDNPAVFAMLLSVCVPIAVYYASSKTCSRKAKILWLTGASGMLVFIGFSESRTGFISAIISSVIVLLSASDIIRKKLLNRRTISILIPLALLLLFLLYRFKADSANGRLLMWRVSMEMIEERPVLGWGHDGFTAHYMEYQARYLTENPDSPFILLADNVNNPFNEYLLVLVNYGIVGFSLLLGLLISLFKSLKSLPEMYKPLMTGLAVGVMTWSFFSYPFSVPFVWVIVSLILIVAFFPYVCNHYAKAGITLSLLCVVGLFMAIHSFIPEREWKIISQRSMQGETEAVLPDYKRLHGRMGKNWRFLYNYGAELHHSKRYDKSLSILDECRKRLNDYDVQMLIGDCLQNTGDTIKAIEHYNYAGRMVPSKFLPQYYIMKLYMDKGDTLNAITVANTILAKDVKVERSKAVQKIIREAQETVKMDVLTNHGNIVNDYQ